MEKYKDCNLSPEERAKDLVSRMTLEEKAEQLRFDAPSIKRLGVPRYNWWNEGLHGVARAGIATMFPQAIALAAMFNDSKIKEVADTISTEARAKYNVAVAADDRDIYKGLTLWSPNINIFRDPRWGRGHETYGECPFLTSKLGVAFVEGLQGDKKVLKTAACAKHFAVHSGPESLRHEFNAEASEKDMEETYLPAFKALVQQAKVESVMGAYNRVNGEPSCGSKVLSKLLKEWGFDGYFVSDCWAIRDFHMYHNVTTTAPESAALALKMGCDVNCGSTYLHILEAYNEGLIDEEDITRAAEHLMRTRIRLGMFDDSTEYDNIPFEVVDCKKHNELSLECAQKSMVLLKNNGILPINKEKVKSIGVIGCNANSREALTGNYHGTASNYTTFLEGIKREFEEYGRVFYSEGCHLYKDSLEFRTLPGDRMAEAVCVAKQSDVVILCLGLDERIEGEQGDLGNATDAGDKLDLRLPKTQRILLEKVLEVGKPTIVVIAAGSAINIETDKPDALIHAWYPGSLGGKALADILFGNVSPSAKLPVTFYEQSEKLPDFKDYSMRGRTYRFVEDNVLYPFGYGLTYSKVECTAAKYDNNIVTATFENTGNYSTDDVVQVYIKDNKSKWAVTNHNLCAFKRIHLEIGESKTVELEIPQLAFEVVDDKGNRFVDSDSFTLYVGNGQPDEVSKSLGVECIKLDINI